MGIETKKGYLVKVERDFFFETWIEAQKYIGAFTKGVPVIEDEKEKALYVGECNVDIKHGDFHVVAKDGKDEQS
ncbi:hypothetical protein ACFOEK_12155 [Litoribrevibacter euphylliae]|uniref:Uncharacterized protein n=1 Tax=Litoribrevibacter euphylliae TaxID=1834034 RepID=A0ABV7HGM9_9GAMM